MTVLKYFYFSQKMDFDILLICMKFGKTKQKKNVTNKSSAKLIASCGTAH